MKADWECKVRQRFRELASMGSTVTELDVDGLCIDIFPGVFSPMIFFESRWFAAEVKKIVSGGSLLEIGTGTGIIALASALSGSKVTVVDVNKAAIENARHNFKKYGIDAQCYVGEVFEPLRVGEQFQFIFWNHPFNTTELEDNDVFLRAAFDPGYRDLERFISDANRYLTNDGRLLLGTSSIANLEEVDKIAGRNGYEIVLLSKIDRQTEIDGAAVDFRVCEFVPRVA